MSRILLADDSPHAQRMGELILREEGYEVVTITDGATVLLRLRDVDPDLILVDVTMPTKSGYEICEYVKTSQRHLHTRVVLVAGALDLVDEQEVLRVGADGVLKKPFEASVVLETVKPLLHAAATARSESPGRPTEIREPADAELVRAAVTIAMDAILPNLIEEITRNVLSALDIQSVENRIMPDNSFDVVSKIDLAEVSNAVQQAMKEIIQRYDLKDSKSNIELNEKDKKLVLASQDEYKLKAVTEILGQKLVKRQVPLKGLSYGTVTRPPDRR